MSFEIRITKAAWADVERIYAWIRDEKRAPRAADRWFNGWIAKLRSLATFPEGRALAPENGAVPGLAVRQQLFGAFRTLYVVRGKRVFIVHSRRASRQAAGSDELGPGVAEAQESDD